MDSTTPANSYPLTEAEKALLAEITRELNNLQQQAQGVLRLALRTRGLDGNWKLEGNQLVRAD